MMTAAASFLAGYYATRIANDPTSPHRIDWEWHMRRFERLAGSAVA